MIFANTFTDRIIRVSTVYLYSLFLSQFLQFFRHLIGERSKIHRAWFDFSVVKRFLSFFFSFFFLPPQTSFEKKTLDSER